MIELTRLNALRCAEQRLIKTAEASPDNADFDQWREVMCGGNGRVWRVCSPTPHAVAQSPGLPSYANCNGQSRSPA